VAAIIAFFAAPWWAVAKAVDYTNYMTAWASNYGILLGPIAGIMIANYWVSRKRNYDLQKLYTFGPSGCWYRGGWSISSYVSLILTWILCYIIAVPTQQLVWFGGIPWPGGVIWYFAVVISFVLKAAFDKYFKE
jgi:NCS1 family nucleobase:cation symporter-1